MRIGLWKISQQTLGFTVDILAEKTKMIAVGEQLIKEFPGLLLFSDLEEAIDEPERAYGKGGRRQAEIVLVFIAVQQAIIA